MSNGDIVLGEVFGTALLIGCGAGVCAAGTSERSYARGPVAWPPAGGAPAGLVFNAAF